LTRTRIIELYFFTIKRVNNMLITPMICLTIINWLMAGSGMREAGSYDCADNYYFF
jgi:hypothetical protein